jgi:hypothetical protein
MISQKLASLEARIAKLESKKAGVGLRPKSPSQINYVTPNVEDVAHMIQLILGNTFHRFMSKQNSGSGLIVIMDSSFYKDEDFFFHPEDTIEQHNNVIANMTVNIVLEEGVMDDEMSYISPYGDEMDDYALELKPVTTFATITFKALGKVKTVEVSFGIGSTLKKVQAQMKPLVAFYNSFR